MKRYTSEQIKAIKKIVQENIDKGAFRIAEALNSAKLTRPNGMKFDNKSVSNFKRDYLPSTVNRRGKKQKVKSIEKTTEEAALFSLVLHSRISDSKKIAILKSIEGKL